MPSRVRPAYFIAHAGRDTARAEALYDVLHPGVSCFLDKRDLLPGDDWDIELPKAQRLALATVVLVSASTEPAYYLREEIASAIAYQRADPERHRLIPVYLDGRPRLDEMVPYGLRVKHSLDMAEIGLGGVAAELRRLAARLQGDPAAATVPVPARPSAAASPLVLFDALCKLLPAQFETVMFRVRAPKHHFAPESSPLARRALDLVQWAEQTGAMRLEEVEAVIDREAPGLLGSTS
jgi:hypothetical protein